jgi:hypothetical protein
VQKKDDWSILWTGFTIENIQIIYTSGLMVYCKVVPCGSISAVMAFPPSKIERYAMRVNRRITYQDFILQLRYSYTGLAAVFGLLPRTRPILLPGELMVAD